MEGAENLSNVRGCVLFDMKSVRKWHLPIEQLDGKSVKNWTALV